MYEQTGDKTDQPLICHSPIKAQYVKNDRDYISCSKQGCEKYKKNICEIPSCTATLRFEVINIRTSIAFILFGGGFNTPCFLSKSETVRFVKPSKPLYGHVSSASSDGTKMRVTWVSKDWMPQGVQYEGGKTKKEIFLPTTFRRRDMCGTKGDSPAKDFGWHDPGWIHSVVIKGLKPSDTVPYSYGSDRAGWSELVTMRTPPAAGSDELRFLAFGDMGKQQSDNSIEHYNQPGSISVVKAMIKEVDDADHKVDSIFHIGGLSYATGFLVGWDYFLHQITPLATQVSYMTAIGDYERHRTMYSSAKGSPKVDKKFISAVEPLLKEYKVDLAIWAHAHNYERTCNVFRGQCLGKPTKDENDVETYNARNYTAPVHVVVGTGGVTLDEFSDDEAGSWSLAKISKFGYLKVHATKQTLQSEFIDATTQGAEDKFRLVK